LVPIPFFSSIFLSLALLKLNVDLNPMMIGTDTRESCGKSGLRKTPAQSAEEAPESPAKKRAPEAEINSQD
jgi:hypothetical protein